MLQVYMNGGPRGRPFKRMSAYVAQEDVFEPTLTAWETLHFHARLRMPRSTTRETMETRMTDTMQTMGLWKSRSTQAGASGIQSDEFVIKVVHCMPVQSL